jgi:hypothetical protein
VRIRLGSWCQINSIIIDKTGALVNVERHDYLPFGEELTTQGLCNTMPGYLGDTVKLIFEAEIVFAS